MAALATIVAAVVAATTVACVLVMRLPWFIADEAGVRLLRPGGRSRWFEGLLVAAGAATAVIAPAALRLLAPAAASPTAASVLTALCLGLAVGAAAGATPFLLWIDLRIRRLPDRIVLPLIALTTAGLLSAWATGASTPVVGGHSPLGAVVVGAGSGLLVLVVSVLGGRGRGLAIGLGDVKLAVVLGSLTALVGTGAVLAAFVVAQLCALAEAAVRVAVLGQGMATRIAYGPHLLVGMWTGPLAYAALR
ncbi:prepilin peptidase [Brevibacterium jeotgali]|uniref:Leader peptidase (Prepilin peptidase) / N-methyltransferase n=1 Tax=Brevibacterium jeotgali TaxID=1262550 RepID=A0A2H1L243_9MICO|nr:prepilin peptidase [Brevibacterium jeotgali]TWC02962.1 leader peptidase (prepilin peptidase)/N-methyltransferase [Brevibacterium jeotgali]SMY10984.1 leader peptidase (prepilin peptidase) / N-methyltransferase [Brevibacterium jeotgali]